MLDADAVVNDSREIDSDAFSDAIEPVMPDAYRLAFGMLRSRDDAGDVVQDAALNAWRRRDTFKPGAEIRPWFLAIVANQCRQTMRQRWWSVIRQPDIRVTTPRSPETPADDAEILRQGLRRLNYSDRLILVLRYYLDLPFSDVAATLRISAAAARVRTHRALTRLRPILEESEDVDE
jgi:RNA polymerase sigma factor (sigma-70 family)